MVSGSSAMPHLGQVPGRSDRTSGSIGQIHATPDDASFIASSDGFFDRKRSGPAANFFWQPLQQKRKVRSW
jgi:hypothetical protein